jgi:hypothetical protein
VAPGIAALLKCEVILPHFSTQMMNGYPPIFATLPRSLPRIQRPACSQQDFALYTEAV